ncbi:protein of unknown function [Kyrpidia spormannii]|uniref:Uncharacterized protein n=2 Tax=Kyrpidia spormannii TaxID=2055160 RepID=A0ACA8Z5A2_9BACL|nr:protein of unknown function [Kyrpidia spormannii]CAB3390555.1 protein of unknown function [Kyrpidia spormannii]
MGSHLVSAAVVAVSFSGVFGMGCARKLINGLARMEYYVRLY